MTTTIDEAKLDAFMGQLAGYMTGATVCLGIWLGDRLGLFQALNGRGPTTADQLAERTNCHPRLVREWLNSQAAGKVLTYDGATDTYELSPEVALAVADEDSPAFTARGLSVLNSLFIDAEKAAETIRGNGALSWADHDRHLFDGTEWFFRTGYREGLPVWIDALEGVSDVLHAGGSIADIGCGHGAAVVVLADLYPEATLTGFDFHAPSVETAKERAAEAGVSDRVSFRQADAQGYDGSYDLICFFDCLHDMGDPVGIMRYAKEHLNPGGTILLVEPFALDDLASNIADNPMAAIFYTASATICTPNSQSQEVGLGIGTQAGAARLREVANQAGLTHVRTADQTPFNLILEVRP